MYIVIGYGYKAGFYDYYCTDTMNPSILNSRSYSHIHTRPPLFLMAIREELVLFQKETKVVDKSVE